MSITQDAPSVRLFDLAEQHRTIAVDLQQAIGSVLASQAFIMGPQVAELERAMSTVLDVRHAVACASGTDALLLPLRDLAQRLGVGSPMVGPASDVVPEVVVPAFTFFATAGAVWNSGLRPVFCDVDESTFNMTAETARPAVTQRTVAVVPVHLYGQMAPVELIRGLVGDHVFLLEDAAQSTGAERSMDGRSLQAGAAGNAGALSFFPTKNLGGIGDGGLVTTNDDALADRLRLLRMHGGRKMYSHEVVGTNSRLDTLQAAVLLAKLPHLDGWISARRRNAALYDELLSGVSAVRIPVVDGANVHSYNQYTLRAERREALRAHLAARGIATAIYYPSPLHLQPCFAPLGYASGDFPVAERLCTEVLSLPIYPELGEERIEMVANAIREFYDLER